MSVNKVILLGNFGQDPEVKYMQDGNAVLNFSLATTESWKGKNGERQNKTEWHKLVSYRKQAEVIGEYFKKGYPIYVEGKLTTRKWQDKDGNDRYSTEIVVKDFEFVSRGNGQVQESSQPKRDPAAQAALDVDQDDLDIPF